MTQTMTLPVLSADSSLSAYIERVSRFPYLSQEEEYMLAKRWSETGDIDAAQKLVTSHLRLVVKIASSFRGYGLPVMDIISEGNLGLMQAIKKFDPEKGFRLSTYAIWWIKASIQEHILKSWSLVKIGTTAAQKKLFFNLRRLKGQLSKLDNNALAPDDVKTIANTLDVSEHDVVEMNSRLSFNDQSLNMPLHHNDEGDSGEMIDMLPEESQSQELDLVEHDDYAHKKQLFTGAWKKLNPREQHILTQRRLQEPVSTLEDLSQELGISRERVRQIEARAIEKLQGFVTTETPQLAAPTA
jgi:RNA polymerase sigma-32 factor